MYLAFHTCICKRVPKKAKQFLFYQFFMQNSFPLPRWQYGGVGCFSAADGHGWQGDYPHGDARRR